MATAISVTEAARAHPDPHLHLPPLSYLPENSYSRGARYPPYSTPNATTPPNVNVPQPLSQAFDPYAPRHEATRGQYNQSISSTSSNYSANSVDRSYPSSQHSPFTFAGGNGRQSYPNSDVTPGRHSIKSLGSSSSHTFEPDLSSLALRTANPLPERTASQSIFSEPAYSRHSTTPQVFSAVSPKHETGMGQRSVTDMLSQAEASRPMPISGLIDSRPETMYSISIRQQPIAARACGFGERDRRVIDPPPILEMKVTEPGASPEDISQRLRNPYCVIHCSLWNAESDTDHTAMDEMGDRRQQRRLMGTLVASPFVGRDENNVEGCFFCFPDLSCRTTGRYRLKFVLVVLDPFRMRPGEKAPFQAIIITDVFRVYAAKDFPGMRSSTELTKRLKEQGCLISVKKGIEKIGEKGTTVHARGGSDEDDEDNTEEKGTAGGSASASGSGKGREKREKRAKK